MPKKPKHPKNKRTGKSLHKNRYVGWQLWKRYYWVAFIIVVGAALLARFYIWPPENLGPQLPPPPANALYKQANQPIDIRVHDLLSRMTLEEKIGQMALVDKNSLIKKEDVSRYNLGGVLSGAGAKPTTNTPQSWADMVDGIKSQAGKSRLGIPLLYGIDANHGNANVLGATIFPHAIGLGASQDSQLTKQVATATAEEIQAMGANWSFSPSLDAPQDIRWGRVYEAFSDDPALNSSLGAAYIEGTQTAAAGSANPAYVMATAKHYVGNGALEWGSSYNKNFKIDQGVTAANDQLLNSEYLLPYQAAAGANVASVMVGLNHWGNGRVIDSKYLITDKLKNQLGFKGFVVSDWYGTYEYSKTSTYRANITTVNAGLDMAMLPFDYKSFLNDIRSAVQRGSISQSRIDDAVSRILYQKFRAGLFDAPAGPSNVASIGSAAHRQLARQAVAASAVLLKNNDGLLPLPKTDQHILVAGSGADNVGRQAGAWTVEWQGVDGNWMPGGTSILQGIRKVAAKNEVIDYSQNGSYKGTADVGIIVVSEKPYAEGWGDSPSPAIDPADLQAIARVKAVSKKVVVVIVSGRPLLITGQLPSWDGAVAAWLPGSEGAGVADVLFGNRPFTGKLPLTWPASLQQVPVAADGTTHDGTPPLFPRYFGL